MNAYILFLDTETSDKPREWNASTTQVDKWPYLLQVAWSIYKNTGELVTQRNFYINPGEISIHEESLKIHGISLEFLQEKGIQRKEVLQKLSNDLTIYTPLIVGHFIKFDIKMLEVGFNRTNIQQDLTKFDKFCTMLNSKHIYHGTQARYLRLDELYKSLFNKELIKLHDALIDAEATKDCFFKLMKEGNINKTVIDRQQHHFTHGLKPKKTQLVIAITLIGAIVLFTLYCIFFKV